MIMKWILITLFIMLCNVTLFAQYDYIVAKDSTGNFTTVQAAIDACRAFPDKQITIYIKKGVYKEKIIIPECNTHLTLLGENRDSTIIWFNDYFDKMKRGRNSTFYTSTLCVEANDFRAENLTIENGAGMVGQAVALHITGDRCVIKNCRLLGFQDTLYASGENRRQLFDHCYIEGTVDFIFGSATAYFNECELHSKINAYVTAANTPQNMNYGFVFNQCNLTANDSVTEVYLGRPWRDYANVVYINCTLGKHILPVGWDNWSTPAREKTAFFAEFNSSDLGANTKQRASWSHQLTKKEAKKYTIGKVFNQSMAYKQDDANWYK
jgi:pectinesterase